MKSLWNIGDKNFEEIVLLEDKFWVIICILSSSKTVI